MSDLVISANAGNLLDSFPRSRETDNNLSALRNPIKISLNSVENNPENRDQISPELQKEMSKTVRKLKLKENFVIKETSPQESNFKNGQDVPGFRLGKVSPQPRFQFVESTRDQKKILTHLETPRRLPSEIFSNEEQTQTLGSNHNLTFADGKSQIGSKIRSPTAGNRFTFQMDPRSMISIPCLGSTGLRPRNNLREMAGIMKVQETSQIRGLSSSRREVTNTLNNHRLRERQEIARNFESK